MKNRGREPRKAKTAQKISGAENEKLRANNLRLRAQVLRRRTQMRLVAGFARCVVFPPERSGLVFYYSPFCPPSVFWGPQSTPSRDFRNLCPPSVYQQHLPASFPPP